MMPFRRNPCPFRVGDRVVCFGVTRKPFTVLECCWIRSWIVFGRWAVKIGIRERRALVYVEDCVLDTDDGKTDIERCARDWIDAPYNSIEEAYAFDDMLDGMLDGMMKRKSYVPPTVNAYRKVVAPPDAEGNPHAI